MISIFYELDDYPGTFTKVSYFLEWIKNTTGVVDDNDNDDDDDDDKGGASNDKTTESNYFEKYFGKYSKSPDWKDEVWRQYWGIDYDYYK